MKTYMQLDSAMKFIRMLWQFKCIHSIDYFYIVFFTQTNKKNNTWNGTFKFDAQTSIQILWKKCIDTLLFAPPGPVGQGHGRVAAVDTAGFGGCFNVRLVTNSPYKWSNGRCRHLRFEVASCCWVSGMSVLSTSRGNVLF